MGYYTSFTLGVLSGDADLTAVICSLKTITGLNCFELSGDSIETGYPVTWYDHDEECAEMSRQFPGVVFKLHGEGGDLSDLWDAYYSDGLCQLCRGAWSMPPFDPARLKPVCDAQREDQERNGN